MLPVFFFIFNYKAWPKFVKLFIIRAEFLSKRPRKRGGEEEIEKTGVLGLPPQASLAWSGLIYLWTAVTGHCPANGWAV